MTISKERIENAIKAWDKEDADFGTEIDSMKAALEADDRWRRENPPTMTDEQRRIFCEMIVTFYEKGGVTPAQIFKFCRDIILSTPSKPAPDVSKNEEIIDMAAQEAAYQALKHYDRDNRFTIDQRSLIATAVAAALAAQRKGLKP